MTIKAILIDDERKALEILKNKIKRFCPDIELIGQTQNPQEGLKMINNLKPQLVFLDIAMPEMSGFDLLTQIEEPNFEVIFVTAFDNYAIDAINHCAIGYLVKPVDNEKLIATVDKAIQNIEEKTALQKNRILIENLSVQPFYKKKIIIPIQEGLEFIAIETIVFCEGAEGYTKVHFKNRKSILSSFRIGHFKKLLENQEFYLIHKSYLINLNYIERYHNEGYVILINKHRLPIARSRRNDFLNSLKNKN